MGKSYAEVTKLKTSFAKTASKVSGVVGIGVSRDPSGEGYQLHVLVTGRSSAGKLPERFGGVAVTKEIVSEPRTLPADA